jgi:hypothetical protein
MVTAPSPHRRHGERFGRVEHPQITVRQGGNVVEVCRVEGIVWIPTLTGTNQLGSRRVLVPEHKQRVCGVKVQPRIEHGRTGMRGTEALP